MNVEIELGMVFCVVDGSDGQTQANEQQSAREQLHRHRRGQPFGSVNNFDEFGSRDRGTTNDWQNYPGKVAREIQVSLSELISLILQVAKGRKRDAARDSKDAVGDESQQVPRHRIKTQR